MCQQIIIVIMPSNLLVTADTTPGVATRKILLLDTRLYLIVLIVYSILDTISLRKGVDNKYSILTTPSITAIV